MSLPGIMPSSQPQAQALADKLPPVLPPDPTKAKVLIPSALVLTREQEDALINHAKRRGRELAEDLGLRDFDSPQWHEGAFDSNGQFRRRHLDTRHMAMMAYQKKYDWRPSVLGGIFEESNLHIPITRRILQQIIARMINYFVGTDPYFAATDVGIEDQDLAERLDRWLKWILDTENDTKAAISAIIERALVCGEADVALYYTSRVSYYQAKKQILLGPDGEPWLSQKDGDFILQGEDEFVLEQVPVLDPTTGLPAMQPGTNMVLKRDGVTPHPGTETYQEQIIWRRAIIQAGPQADLLMPYDFLVPLNCKDIDLADCVVHHYDEPLINLVHRLQQGVESSPEEMMSYCAALMQRLLPSGTTNLTAADNKGRPDLGEPVDGLGQDKQEPQINWTRYCLFYDALNTGNLSNIILIMDKEGTTPLFYDYIENFTPDKRRPYRRVRVNPVAGRSDGQGLVELFEDLQTDADLVFNRWNFSLSSAARVDFWHPENTVEGDTDPNLELGGGRAYRMKAGKEMKDIIQSHYLTDIKSMPLREMLEFILQLAMNMSGVSNVNDGQTAGLDTTKLATGVRNLEKSGQELTDKTVSDLRPGIEDLLQSLMLLAAAHLEGEKTFRFFNGDVGSLTTIKPEEVRNLTLDVKMELTKYRGEQELQQNSQAANAAAQFFAQSPEAQARTAPLYRQILKANGIKNADDIIVPVSPLPPAGSAGLPPAAETPTSPPPIPI